MFRKSIISMIVILIWFLQNIPLLVVAVQQTAGAAEGPIPLRLCIQNCNSLNLAGLTGNFDSKLMAIVMSKADVILLSDTRVVSSQGVSSTQRIANWLRSCKVKQYTPFFNSSMNSRGTAILFASSLDITINTEYRDLNENYYIVDVNIEGKRFCIGSVYGPNGNGREFFNGLTNVLQDIRGQNNGNLDIILGGDWNTT
jgi:exonuclease III